MSHGPNVTKLILKYVASEAIPSGGGFMDDEKRRAILVKAEAEALKALAIIKAASDQNQYNSDEEIAALLLKKIAEREAGRKQRR